MTFACSEDFKEFLTLLINKLNIPASQYIHDAVVGKMQNDISDFLLQQPHLNKTLAEIIRQGFA